QMTNSEIAFGVNGVIRVATLPEATWPRLVPLLNRPGAASAITPDGDDYLAFATPLGPQAPNRHPTAPVPRAQAGRRPVLPPLRARCRTRRATSTRRSPA